MKNFDRLDALYPLPPAELSRQWVLSRQKEVLPDEWAILSLAGWQLAAHPDANVCELHSRDGVPIGWVIEPLAYIGRENSTVPERAIVTLPVDRDFTPTEIERALYGRDASGHSDGSGFAGNWTAIVVSSSGACQRLYLGAAHSIVYSQSAGMAVTTHNLVPDLERDVELSSAFDPITTKAYYTFGLTAFIGLSRLLPNHCLDLGNFEVKRHWPVDSLGERIEGSVAAATMVQHARTLLDVLAERYDTFQIPLSAGRDSRAILACARPFTHDKRVDIKTFTSSMPNLASQTDVAVAGRLARIARVHHRIKKIVPQRTEQADIERAFVRLGESKYGVILTAPSRQQSAPLPGVLSLPGMAGETARSFFWRDRRPAMADMTPAELASRMGSPLTDSVLAAAGKWYEGLPKAIRESPCDTLDLAYIEQRMGCWESSTRYLFPGPGRANLSLMATTISLETMLRLPEDYRAAGLLQRDMVACGWPELLALPFNTPVGRLRFYNLGQRLRRLPRRAGRALRHRLAGSAPSTGP